MGDDTLLATEILEHVVELLDIPPSHYEKARDRYESLGEWLHRPQSKVLVFDPDVYPQGSFRYGTVIRPLLRGEEYDLDLVCQLTMSKEHVSQAELKALVGEEIKEYATAHNMNEPAREKSRCWRLEYADDVSFHMDILPAIPDDEAFKRKLIGLGVPAQFAVYAVAITDRRHPRFRQVQPDWPRSNPRGFAAWFEERMQPVSHARRVELVRAGLYASVDDVPAYEWKTPLQRAIQILERHRDVMFQDAPDLKPISMVITTLSAESYESESYLFEALSNILDRMPHFVRDESPRVPNPVNPHEDFADKWAANPRLERSFWEWHAQARADLNRLLEACGEGEVDQIIRGRFQVSADRDVLRRLCAQHGSSNVSVMGSAPVIIKSALKPWGQGA